MNIVVLSHRIPFPPNKGEKIRTYNQIEHLLSHGCKVTLFCLLHESADKNLARSYAENSNVRIVSATTRFNKLKMIAGAFLGRSFSVSNFYSSRLQSLVDQHFDVGTVDAIYCTSSSMAEYLFKGNWKHKYPDKDRKYLIDFMDLDSDKWRQYAEINKFPLSLVYRYEERMLARYEKKIQQTFDHCIFISRNEVTLFSSKLAGEPANLSVVGNGVDLAEFHPRGQPRTEAPLTLLFSGVMDYFPNENAMCWFVDNVWPLLKPVYPECRLVIAGMNPGQKILKMAEDPSITVTGFVEDMLACYHEADIFVAPFQIARGVQNKILQSFACGLPVVTTPIGAEGIDCTNGKEVLIVSTPEQFVESISRLATDKGFYSQVSENALELVNGSYTWGARNSELLELFGSREAA